MTVGMLQRRVSSAARRRSVGGAALSDWSAPLLVYTGCSAVQASGTGISQYQSLTGADFDNQVNAAPIGNVVSLASGTFSWSDFTNTNNGVINGAAVTRKGLRGVGVGSTILQMTASTSTHAADVPTTTGQTNQLYLMYFDHDDLELSCLTVQGTNQGHLYNGIRLHNVDRALLRNVKLIGSAPGNNFFPPGETFAINWFGGADSVFENCEIDGRVAGTGVGTDGTGFGANSFSGGTWRSCYGHHCFYSAAFALWQGTGTVNMYDCRGGNCRTNLNLERMGREAVGQPRCTMNVYDFEFGPYVVAGPQGDGQDLFFGNDQGSTILNIYRPKFTAGRTVPSGRDPNKIYIFFPVNEQGNPNLQAKSDVHVYDENGADITAATIQWSR